MNNNQYNSNFPNVTITETSYYKWISIIKSVNNNQLNEINENDIDKVLVLTIDNTVNKQKFPLSAGEIVIEGFGRQFNGYILQPHSSQQCLTRIKALPVLIIDNFIEKTNEITLNYTQISIIPNNTTNLKLIIDLLEGQLGLYVNFSSVTSRQIERLHGKLHVLDRLDPSSNRISPCIALEVINFGNLVIEIPNPKNSIGRVLNTAIYGIVKDGLIVEKIQDHPYLYKRPTTNISSQIIAIKIIFQSRLNSPQIGTENPMQEISAMIHFNRAFNSLISSNYLSNYELACLTEGKEYIIRLLGLCRDNKAIYIIMPYINGGELFNYFNSFQLTEPEVQDLNESNEINNTLVNIDRLKRIIRQILLGTYVLHRCGISHRDISLENTLIKDFGTANETCLLMDFGMAELIHRDLTSVFTTVRLIPTSRKGKPYYQPFEIYQQTPNINPYACDMWQCGVLIYILMTGNAPYLNVNKIDSEWFDVIRDKKLWWKNLNVQLSKNSDKFVTKQLCKIIPEILYDLLVKLLEVDPSTRLTSIEVLDHEFFRTS